MSDEQHAELCGLLREIVHRLSLLKPERYYDGRAKQTKAPDGKTALGRILDAVTVGEILSTDEYAARAGVTKSSAANCLNKFTGHFVRRYRGVYERISSHQQVEPGA